MIRVVRWKEDYTILTAIDRNAGDAAQDSCFEVAEALKNDIKSNWSPSSPSPVGSPPGIDQGYLDEGVAVDAQGRDELGRFAAGGDVKTAFVRVDTGESGRQYAQAVQEYSKRPFFEAAVQRTMLVFPQSMSVFFEKLRRR